VKAGGTTSDGLFTLEHAECQAACTEAPNMQVNYRHCHRMTTNAVRPADRRPGAGRLDGEIPAHGTLARVRQQIPAAQAAGVASPDAPVEPAWMPAKEATS
jgi:NADH-quinone oxidoreductase subunit E